MNRSYLNARGYSLGYWYAVLQNGDAYQIRGPGEGATFNSAANKGDKVVGNANDWTFPILLEAYEVEASAAAIATCRSLWSRWGIQTRPWPHSDLDATGCCGDIIRNQIYQGLFDNRVVPAPPVLPITFPPTTTIQETDGMLYIIQPMFPAKTDVTEWLVKFEDGHLERALGSSVAYALGKGIPIVPEVSQEHYEYQLARRILPPMPA